MPYYNSPIKSQPFNFDPHIAYNPSAGFKKESPMFGRMVGAAETIFSNRDKLASLLKGDDALDLLPKLGDSASTLTDAVDSVSTMGDAVDSVSTMGDAVDSLSALSDISDISFEDFMGGSEDGISFDGGELNLDEQFGGSANMDAFLSPGGDVGEVATDAAGSSIPYGSLFKMGMAGANGDLQGMGEGAFDMGASYATGGLWPLIKMPFSMAGIDINPVSWF